MADEILSRDQNHVTVLAGITDDSNQYVTMLRVDPTTKRLQISATGIVSPASDTQVLFNDNGAFGGDSTFTFNKTTDVLTVTSLIATNIGQNSSVTIGGGTTSNVTVGNNTDSTLLFAATDFFQVDARGSCNLSLGINSTHTGQTTIGVSNSSNLITIGSGDTSNGNTQTITIGGGTPTGTGKKTITIGNTAGASSVTVEAGTGLIKLNSKVGINKAATATSPLSIGSIPTSSAGLVTGDVWSNSGVLTIV